MMDKYKYKYKYKIYVWTRSPQSGPQTQRAFLPSPCVWTVPKRVTCHQNGRTRSGEMDPAAPFIPPTVRVVPATSPPVPPEQTSAAWLSESAAAGWLPGLYEPTKLRELGVLTPWTAAAVCEAPAAAPARPVGAVVVNEVVVHEVRGVQKRVVCVHRAGPCAHHKRSDT